MYYVYLLSLANEKIYTGSTRDLKQRITQHQNGKVQAAKAHLPLKLIYYEAYYEESDARTREKYLKTGDGRKEVRKQLYSTLRNIAL